MCVVFRELVILYFGVFCISGNYNFAFLNFVIFPDLAIVVSIILHFGGLSGERLS